MSSITTALRQKFELQDLPARAMSLGEDMLSEVFGGCKGGGQPCRPGAKGECCQACLTVPGPVPGIGQCTGL
jgi:hypothetical protein